MMLYAFRAVPGWYEVRAMFSYSGAGYEVLISNGAGWGRPRCTVGQPWAVATQCSRAGPRGGWNKLFWLF